MATVDYSLLASADVVENADYIAKDKPLAAYQWIERIEQTCALLALNPQMGEVRETRGYGKCRSFSCGNYVIFFRGIEEGVEIVRVLRAERDIDQF